MSVPYSPEVEKVMCGLFDSLGERERRLYAATEVLKLGRGGLLYLANLFGCDPKTIRRGRQELLQGSSVSRGRSRKKGGDEKRA